MSGRVDAVFVGEQCSESRLASTLQLVADELAVVMDTRLTLNLGY